MLRPSKRIEYALMCLKFMATKPEDHLTSAREICDQFKTPFDTTAKVMQILNNAQILKSVKGVKGGYKLVADLTRISYFDIAVLIDGPSFENHCTREEDRCQRLGVCIISKSMNLLDREMANFLKGVTIADIVNEKIIQRYGMDEAPRHTCAGPTCSPSEEQTATPLN